MNAWNVPTDNPDLKSMLERTGELLALLSKLDQCATESEVVNIIPKLMESVGAFTGSDRVYIVDHREATPDVLTCNFEWCAPGVPSLLGTMGQLPTSQMPHALARLQRGETVRVDNVEDIREIAPEEYEVTRKRGTTSVILFPIFAGTHMGGFVGVDNPNLKNAPLPPEGVLTALGGHLGSLRSNMRARALLEQERLHLQETAEEARRANDAKSEFLRRMSHDIRTPINGIRGMIEIANHFPNDMEKQAECREKMWLASGYLLSLVNDILDMSKVESGKVTLENKPFNLIQLFDEVSLIASSQAVERGVEYIVEKKPERIGHPNVMGSPTHLKQILTNVASNAVKYNREGGSVTTSCIEHEAGPNESVYEFICEDTGIGMSAEFLEHAFEPFAQEELEGGRTNYSGTGLGLAIAKGLAQQMGGDIQITSTEGVGTKVVMKIPFTYSSDSVDADTQVAGAGDIKGMHVLMVEDNDLNSEIARFMLEDAGANVTSANNGREAIEAFESSEVGHFDAILMDIMMPVMGGLEATQRIRALDRTDAKTVPIIAMTANAFTDDIQRSLDAGMNEHLTKPLDQQAIVRSLGKYWLRK